MMMYGYSNLIWKTMRMIKGLLILTGMGMLALTLLKQKNLHSKHRLTSSERSEFSLSYKLENEGNTWAYSILIDGKAVIYQNHVPVYSGNYLFFSRDSAEIVARWVCLQLSLGHNPGIDKETLDSLFREI